MDFAAKPQGTWQKKNISDWLYSLTIQNYLQNDSLFVVIESLEDEILLLYYKGGGLQDYSQPHKLDAHISENGSQMKPKIGTVSRSDIYDLRSRNRNFEIAITHEIGEK